MFNVLPEYIHDVNRPSRLNIQLRTRYVSTKYKERVGLSAFAIYKPSVLVAKFAFSFR